MRTVTVEFIVIPGDKVVSETPHAELDTFRITMPRSAIEIVDSLISTMNELVLLALYPAHVLPIPGRIEGTAFSPGGTGLYSEARDRRAVEFPRNGAMILGHNFDSEVGFRKSFANGRENLNVGTWRSLLDLLKDAGIPTEKCFFTNAFMGLCEGEDNKKYLGRSDASFRAACLEFLKAQIRVQQPRLILALGLHVPPLLASASDDLNGWVGHFT